MNGPSSMYKLKPVFQLPENIELPTCMYKMKNIVTGDNSGSLTKNEKSEIVQDISNKKPLPEVAALEKRWDLVLEQLAELKKQMADIKSAISSESRHKTCQSANLKVLDGAVINASPSNPPYSLLLIKRLFSNAIQLKLSCHVHSTVKGLPEVSKSFSEDDLSDDNALKLILIWKEGLLDTELIIHPVKQLAIKGEVNILRHLGRLGLSSLGYPTDDAVETIQIDSVLDTCHRLLHVRTGKEKTSIYRNLNAKLGKSSYFGGENVNISDIAVWSVLKQIEVNTQGDLSQNMAKWFQRVDQLLD